MSSISATPSLIKTKNQLHFQPTLAGSINWAGQLNGQLHVESQTFPAMTGSAVTVISPPINATLYADGEHTEIELGEQFWRFQQGRLIRSYQLAPSTLSIANHARHWSITIPEFTANTETAGGATRSRLFSIADIYSNTTLLSKGTLLNGRYSLSIGTVEAQASGLTTKEGKPLITGMTLSSQFEQIDPKALINLFSLASEIKPLPKNSADRNHKMLSAMATLTQTTPSITIDKMILATEKGDVQFSFSLSGTHELPQLLTQLQNIPPLSSIEQKKLSSKIINAFNTSASVKFSDDILNWGCEALRDELAEEGNLTANAALLEEKCKTIATSGTFFIYPCLNILDTAQQTQCLAAMKQAERVWTQKREIKLSLQEGTFFLNDAEVSTPIEL